MTKKIPGLTSSGFMSRDRFRPQNIRVPQGVKFINPFDPQQRLDYQVTSNLKKINIDDKFQMLNVKYDKIRI